MHIPHLYVLTCWKILSDLLLSSKVMFAQCYWKFSIHFILSPGNSAINILICTSIFACKRFLMAFSENSLIFSLLFLDHLEVLHKFLCTVKISSPVILQMWENKSGAGVDPHLVWTWLFFIYMPSSETFPLNVRIILSDHFSDCSSSYVVCICNHYRRKNQNRLLIMGLTSHISCISDAFSSYRVSFSLICWICYHSKN